MATRLRLFIAPALLAASACSLNLEERANGMGSSFTRGVMTQLRADSSRETIRTLTSDAVTSASGAYGVSFQPRLDTTIFRVLQSGHAFVSTERDSLLTVARGPGKAVVEDAVESSVRKAGDESRRQLRLAIGDATDALQREMIPILVQTTRDAARDAARDASDAAFASASPRLQLLVDSVVASAVRVGIEQGNHELQQSPVWKTAIVIGSASTAVLLLIGAAWIWYDRNRLRSALAAVMSAVQDTPDNVLKTRIRQRAEGRHVAEYLRSFLVKEGRM